MHSPAKAIGAGALAFAIGGVLLIAQPFQQQGGIPGAAVDVEPVWVTGTTDIAGTHCSEPTVLSEVGSVRRERDYRCETQTWTADDPRLAGRAVTMWNADVYRIADGPVVSVTAGTYEMVNDEGEWLCRSDDWLAEGSGTSASGHERVRCVGGGGQGGLTAILDIDWTSVIPPFSFAYEGIVFSGEAPLPPDPSAAE